MCEFKFLGGLSVVLEEVDVPEQVLDGALWQLGSVVMSIGGWLVVVGGLHWRGNKADGWWWGCGWQGMGGWLLVKFALDWHEKVDNTWLCSDQFFDKIVKG